MIDVSKTDIIKKWIPIIGIVLFIVLAIGLVFGISGEQIISSITISLILIISGLLFQRIGRNRSKNNDNGNDINRVNKE